MLPALVLTILVPCLVGYGVTGILRRLGGRKTPSTIAGIGVTAGFLAGYVGIAGGLPFWSIPPHYRVGEVAVLALPVGLLLNWIGTRPMLLRCAASLCGIFTVGWCLGVVQQGEIPPDSVALAVVATLFAGLSLWRLATLALEGGTVVAVLAIMALALAVIAHGGHAELSEDMALALMAASVGWLVWARPLAKVPAGAAAAVGGGVVMVGIAVDTAQTSLHPPWALLVLPLCLWADWLAARLPWVGRLGRRKSGRPLAFSLGAVVPALLAACLAVILANLHSKL